MILQALYKLAQREGLMADPDYESKPIAWIIRLSKDGKILGKPQGTHYVPPSPGKKNPKPIPKKFVVPIQPQKSGKKAKPGRLLDNALYVFGKDLQGKFTTEESMKRADWFREEVKRWAEGSGDEAVYAVYQFLDDIRQRRQSVELPEECNSNDLFGFVYEPDVDQLVTERGAVRRFWTNERNPSTEENGDHQCLVTNQSFDTIPLFPQVKVPGGTPKGVSLVSYNANAFESYGWRRNENAPISRQAAEACATAMARLIDPAWPNPHEPGLSLPKRNLRLSSDTVVLYWSAEESGDDFADAFAGIMEADQDAVKALYQCVWNGQTPDIDNPSAFYALTLTGTQGRIIVRSWLESTVAEAARHLAAHFADLDIVHNTPPPKKGPLPPQPPMSLLLRSLAPWGESKQIPAPLIGQMLGAVLKGTSYPFSVLQRALERTRAEIGGDEWSDSYRRDARAALIKAVLNRRKRFFPETTNYLEVKRDMDPNNHSQGYMLGQLLAVLERLQQEALGDVNATVVDRYFSGASATPKSVFVRLLKNARNHARKAQDQDKGGLVYRLERLMDEIADRFDPDKKGFPAYLDLEQQGLFVLGYHQMRKWLWMSKEERTAWENDHPAAPRAYLWGKKLTESPTNLIQV